jgi:hypothetical protein
MDIPLTDRIIRTMIASGIPGVNTARRIVGSPDEITARNRYGAVFRLCPDNYIDRVVLRDGYYESEVLDAILDGLPSQAVVWDVGANFGLHGITLKVLRPDVRVICFEPAPEQADRIIAHSELNAAPVEVLRIGLGDERKTATLHCVSGNPGMSTFVPWDQATYSPSVAATPQPRRRRCKRRGEDTKCRYSES